MKKAAVNFSEGESYHKYGEKVEFCRLFHFKIVTDIINILTIH